MSTLYVLCGLPGSGKTTYAKQLSENTGIKRYSFDEYPGACDPRITKQAKQQMYKDIRTDLNAGHQVILDDLHTKKEWRSNLLSTINAPCQKILIVMNTPVEECLIRNRQRKHRALPDFIIKTLNQTYEHPALSEGWDEIIYI